MKKVIAWLLVLTLTAAVSIGATLAYLTDTDEDVNVMTLGKVKIDQLEYERIDDETANEDAKVQEFHDNKPLYPAVTGNGFDYTPGDTKVDWAQIGKDGYTSEIWNPENINNEQDKMVFIKNKGDYDAFVRTVFAFEAGNYTTLDQFKSMVHMNLNESDYAWEWVDTPVEIPNAEGGTTKYFIATATYNKILAPGALTEISLSQIALDKTATNADVEAFGETYQILVKSQGIQADGFASAKLALDEGFGLIDAADIPWETDAPTKGSALKTALHQDPDGNPITTKVTSIVFGKKADYPQIVNNNKGTLIDVDQDVEAHAYYVTGLTKAAGDYTVYVLSSDTIYAPEDSTGLFRGMTELISVDARNLNMSRVDNTTYFFRDCTKLQKVDTTGWDTSNITNMQGFFYKCNALTEITGIKSWDVSNVTSLYATFYNLHALTELDLSGWDTGSVTKMDYVIANNNNLETINLTGWDWSNVETSTWAFRANPKLKNVIGSGDWYMPKNTDMYGMMSSNTSLVSLDVSNWDTGSCTRYHDMFVADSALETIIGLENWDTGSAVNMISLFNGCASLKNFGDLSGWDVRNVTDIGYMFAGCMALEELTITGWDASSLLYVTSMFRDARNLRRVNLSGWNTPNLTRMNSMFTSASSNSGNMKLEEVNLSGWYTGNVDTMGWMFYGCGSLVTVDMSNWNVEKLTTMGHMFADCFKLENVYFTNWNTPSLICLDGVFNDCRVMKTVDMSSFNTSKVKEFSQTFEACWALEKVIGMENWDTSSACTFTEMFSGCGKLKELDLSSFDTSAAFDNYTDMNNSTSHAFVSMLSSVKSLEKLVVSDKISYYGNGNVTEGRKLVFPNPVAKEGYTAMWRNVETGELFLGKDIPSGVAATYVADYEYTPSGATTFNALNYLNADSSGTKITTKVSSITYGLSKDYETITSQYTGVLADQDQDVPVYAYYVPNGSYYDVYMLADDTIYLPMDATKLCNGMSNLTTLNVDNLSTERTTTFKGLFQGCSKLQTLDVSNWDVSNVNDFIAAFNGCGSLKLTGYEDWDTSKVTNMQYLFQGCASLETLDLSGWDTSKVTTMASMFQSCHNLVSVDATGWDTSKVTTMYQMFVECYELDEIRGIEDWDTSKVVSFSLTFNKCYDLQNLDVSKWDTGSGVEFNSMFARCESLTELDLSGWDVSNAKNFKNMFYGCTNLQNLNVSGWDTGNVTNFAAMFASPNQNAADMKFTKLDVADWDTGSATDMHSMFYGCGSLTELDLGAWDVSKVITMSHMFADCRNLVDLNLNGWVTSSLISMDCIFNDCDSLVTVDVSTFKTQTVKEFSQVFESCESLQTIVGLENWDTSNGCIFEEMFAGCSSLTALNLSSFNTGNARNSYKSYHGDTYSAFGSMFSNVNSLQTLILGENFKFDGNGTVPQGSWVKLPNPAGTGTKWYNADNGTYYAASEIPEETAATYVAAVPPANP